MVDYKNFDKKWPIQYVRLFHKTFMGNSGSKIILNMDTIRNGPVCNGHEMDNPYHT